MLSRRTTLRGFPLAVRFNHGEWRFKKKKKFTGLARECRLEWTASTWNQSGAREMAAYRGGVKEDHQLQKMYITT